MIMAAWLVAAAASSFAPPPAVLPRAAAAATLPALPARSQTPTALLLDPVSTTSELIAFVSN